MTQKSNSSFISVIVTTFNRKELLKETIDSILTQTYKNFELIVVDNYSNYDFFSHIEGFNDNRIRPFQNANYGIIAANRNFGILHAIGEYIAFCDDDDLWVPEKLEKVITAISENSDSILFCHNEVMMKDGRKIKKLIYGPYRQNMFEILLFKGNCVSLSAVTLKTDIALETGGFSENKCFVSAEDYEYWIRLSKKGPFFFINDFLGVCRIFENNTSNNIIFNWEAIFSVRDFHFIEWLRENPDDSKKINLSKSKLWTSMSNVLRKSRNFKLARRYIFNGIRTSPLYWKNYAILVLSLVRINKF